MTNKIQITEKDRRTKILVIDDSVDVQKDFFEILQKRGDYPRINREDIKKSLRAVESFLRKVPYKAILMDGNLELKLDGSCDGAVLTNFIQEGRYGSLNKETPIYNISASYTIPRTLEGVYKEGNIEECLKKVRLI